MAEEKLKRVEVDCDFCVVGGGLAGTFAALSAARRGVRTVLIQDRPMPGGNCSSEIRMWIRGAVQPFRKETGLISEFEQRNIYYNPALNASLGDATLYAMLSENPFVDAYFNCSVFDLKMKGDRIHSVTGWQMTTYTLITVRAKLFADCSGDSILAPLSGAHYTVGREDRRKYDESLAFSAPDKKTMGLSLILSARETPARVNFTPPAFARLYVDDNDIEDTSSIHRDTLCRSHDIRNNDNLWWIELGGDGDSLHDADKVRGELMSCVYGVWDHIKNHGDHGMENFDLDWAGCLPGKRESLRYVGDYVLTQRDLESGGDFYDEVAYGGWPMDDHDPEGLKRADAVASRQIRLPEVYGIPYRSLYSENIPNLLFAGRNISVSHVALSSSRVMATCALEGQAAGEAAALALERRVSPRRVLKYIGELQQRLIFAGVFLPHTQRQYTKLSLSAQLNMSREERARLFSGVERPVTRYGENDITVREGESLVFEWKEKQFIKGIHLVFDEGLDREWLPGKLKKFAYRLHSFLSDRPLEVYAGMIKGFCIFADGKKVFEEDNNFLALRNISLNVEAKKLSVVWTKLRKEGGARVFAADVW